MTTTDTFTAMWDAPMSNRGFLVIRLGSRSPESVEFSGMEHGKLTILSRTEVPELGTVLVLHEEGHSYWAGRPPSKRGYAPAQVHTVLLGAPSAHHAYRYVKLASSEVPGATERRDRSIRHATALREAI